MQAVGERPDVVVAELHGEAPRLVGRIRREARSWVPIIAVARRLDRSAFAMTVRVMREAASDVVPISELDALGDRAAALAALSLESLRRHRHELDRRSILEAWPDCEGNVSKLSRMTEIPRSTLYGHLRELGLRDP